MTRFALIIAALVGAGTLASCSPSGLGGQGCTAGRFDSSTVGAAATPDGALNLFLASSDAAGLPANGWQTTSTASSTVVFEDGSARVTTIRYPDGWGVLAYTTCAP